MAELDLPEIPEGAQPPPARPPSRCRACGIVVGEGYTETELIGGLCSSCHRFEVRRKLHKCGG